MRITGGELGGRTVRVPSGDAVRPTQDRVREALFSSLAARVPGCRFLDLFAGSGSVGLEAWSRGAAEVWWVEGHAATCRLLRDNLRALGVTKAGHAFAMDVAMFLRSGPPASGPFDIIFADPPYGTVGTGRNPARRGRYGPLPLPALLTAVVDSHRLAPDGVFVLETATDEVLTVPADWSETWSRTYGSTVVRMYRFFSA